MSPFTASAWTVTDGAIVTTSSTTLTIPVFPIVSASLLALSLTVGLGLGIVPGDSIKIADTATGRNYMYGYVASYVASTGALVVQIGVSFLFEIRRIGPRYQGYQGSGYTPYYDFGTPDECGPLLRATNGNGISIIDIGFIQVLIPAAMMQKLRGGTYSAAMVMTDGVNTRQIEVGQLPIIHGGTALVPLATIPSTYNPNIF